MVAAQVGQKYKLMLASTLNLDSSAMAGYYDVVRSLPITASPHRTECLMLVTQCHVAPFHSTLIRRPHRAADTSFETRCMPWQPITVAKRPTE